MKIAPAFAIFFVLYSASLCYAEALADIAPLNLIPDASFESPVPSWFSTEGKGSYFAGKEKVAGAADGSFVLAVQGWDNIGSKILSAPLDLRADAYSATWKVRSFGDAPGAQIELVLFDEKGEQKLFSLGTFALNGNGQWSDIKATGVKPAVPATRGRLAWVLSGPQEGARIEIDQVGFYAGSTPGTVNGATDFISFEAEEMANATSWKAVGHFVGWYSDLPSGMKMLTGADGVAEADNAPVSKAVAVRMAGLHRLWVRFLRFDAPNNGKYTITLRQNGQAVATKEIDDGDAKLGATHQWAWASVDANVQPGEVEIVLSRPAGGTSWVARKVDLFLLTNLLDYKPQIQDFRPQGYMRFTNTSTQAEPYTIWTFVHRHQPPVYYVTPGVLSNAGLSGSYYVPADRAKWLAPGETTPWVNISEFLLPGGGRNNFQILATRDSHTTGLAHSGFQGILEFAVGDERRVVKKVEVNQNAPRLLMTLPYDLQNKSEEILTSADHLLKVEAALDQIGKPHGRVAKHLDLNAILGLSVQMDDPAIIERELNVIKRLGFNGTYTPVTEPKDVVEFNTRHGLENHLGLWVDTYSMYKNGCMNQPDVAQIEAVYKQQAEKFAPMMSKVERMKLSDEPSGPAYEHAVGCDVCKTKFREGLKTQGLTPADLGVASWDEVVPVLPADREKQPALFYHSGLFRLRTFADMGKLNVALKRKYLPANARTYVNYSPPLSEHLTWTQRGNDLWMIQRDGLELGWTEDWLGYGATPQQISPLYAQLRAAGSPTNQPLGAYMVGVSGGPLLQRIKYYEMAANGVRHINVYAYGPHYASVDSWSTAYQQYPAFSRVQHELGVIDEALNGATRRKTDVAILYNRTAGIWMHNTSTTEQDSRYTHFALAHAGYDADFIAEEDIVAGQLAKYKVLYLNGVQIRRDAAGTIAGWVQDGGVLAGSVGAGTRDEYNRPLDVLEKVFGATGLNLKLEHDTGRPKYELRSLPVLDVLSTVAGSGAPQVTLNQLSYRETLVPAADAKVILKNKAGEATGVLHAFGKGQAIRIAAVPAITYLNDAVRDEKYDIDSYLPKLYRKELRDFIVWPAMMARAFRVAHASTPITEITRYDGKAGTKSRAVVFVIDHNAVPNPQFSMTLPQAGQFTRAYTASGKPVIVRKLGEALQVSFALDVADALVLEQ